MSRTRTGCSAHFFASSRRRTHKCPSHRPWRVHNRAKSTGEYDDTRRSEWGSLRPPGGGCGSGPTIKTAPAAQIMPGSNPGEIMPNAIERLLTSDEVGAILGIHPKVVERMAKRGDLPGLKVGKFWRYRASSLDGWIDSRLQSCRQPCRTETSF